jgi:hypothetical protein
MSEVARVSYFENYIDTLKRRMKQKGLMRNDKKSKIIEIEIVLQHLLTLLYQRKT